MADSYKEYPSWMCAEKEMPAIRLPSPASDLAAEIRHPFLVDIFSRKV
jgi:hypothetical protein